MAEPLLTKKIVKKRVQKFKRPQSDHKISVKTSWRRPKGIDSRGQRKFKGCTLMPDIGYGSQEDSSLSSKLLQKICCPQCQRARGVDDAQQDVLC